MTTSISRYWFAVPAAILICFLAVRFTEPNGPSINDWISQTEVKYCFRCLGNGDWAQAGIHMSRSFTGEGYLLCALFLSIFLGLRHYFSEWRKQKIAADFDTETLQDKGNRLGNMGLACSESGQIEKAIEYYAQALATARQIGDHQVAGRTLGNLGNAYQTLGQMEKAVGYHKQALTIFRDIGDRQGEGSVLANIGKVYNTCGQVNMAIKYNKQSLLIFEEINSPYATQLRSWLSELGNQDKSDRV